MKTKSALAIILLCIICTGCKKPTECKVSHWPDSDVTISWDSINDVKTLKEYFDCHDSAIYSNFSKPIQVCGYIKKYVDTSRFFYGPVICSDSFMTADNYIILLYLDGAPIHPYDSTCISKVTGRIGPPYEVLGCCSNKLAIFIQKIEKL